MSKENPKDDAPKSEFSIQKTFLTGLVLFLPLALTITFVIFIFNLLTAPFLGLVETIFIRYHLFEGGFWILSAEQLRRYSSQLLILVFLFSFILMLGVLARGIFVHYFMLLGEFILSRTPIIRTVYKTSKDLVNTLFKSDSITFKRAVLVPFPQSSYSIGLIAQESVADFMDEKRVAVFMPTAPLPTSGFVMFVKADELVFLDISVEDAIKYIISCGVVHAP